MCCGPSLAAVAASGLVVDDAYSELSCGRYALDLARPIDEQYQEPAVQMMLLITELAIPHAEMVSSRRSSSVKKLEAIDRSP
jgi:hypothetical protein